ncbi:hypothetical protein [Noviherbaspirillum album]|uniref:hypothetical protein n=1 Tax=Noviherbaspirillum album TaxID=3080276 RepID=UPI002DD69441|nr:hypothetical protein [Noviherbaspirillum sp. CPCC 100848]
MNGAKGLLPDACGVMLCRTFVRYSPAGSMAKDLQARMRRHGRACIPGHPVSEKMLDLFASLQAGTGSALPSSLAFNAFSDRFAVRASSFYRLTVVDTLPIHG